MQNNEEMNPKIDFSKHFAQYTNEEIHLLLSNLFYQHFLIDVTDIHYVVKTNEFGQYTEIKVSGNCFKDEDGDIVNIEFNNDEDMFEDYEED